MNKLVPSPNDLIAAAYRLDGPEAGSVIEPSEVPEVLKQDVLGWVHLQARHADAPAWIIANLSYLDPTIVEALVADETRPRVSRIGNGLLVILRGINMNKGQDPEDMVSVRLWIDPHRIISLSLRRVVAIEDIAQEIELGTGPTDAGAFLATLAERLNFRIESFWRKLEEEADDMEEEVVTEPRADLRTRLVELRRKAIILRRYLQPQRDALRVLMASHPDWLEEDDLRELGEELDALERIVEDSDALRDRMAVVRDELASQLSDRLNRNMYLLSILSALFLPLGFLTGLFGINVAGVPGAETPGAFWIFSGVLVVLVAVQMYVLRRLRWI